MFAALMLFFTYVRLQDANERVAKHSQIVLTAWRPYWTYGRSVSGNRHATAFRNAYAAAMLTDRVDKRSRRCHRLCSSRQRRRQ